MPLRQRVHGPNDPFIFDTPSSVGLQDRIEELLTKPRYRLFADRSQSSAEVTQSTEANPIANFDGTNSELEYSEPRLVSKKPPRRRRLSPQQARAARPSAGGLRPKPERVIPEFIPERSFVEHSVSERAIPENSIAMQQYPPTQRVRRAPEPQQRPDSEVRLAYEMEQRIKKGARANPFQQVARVAPVQDPFNDGFRQFGPESSSSASQFKSRSPKTRVPAKQVSILSNRSRVQDDDSPFGIAEEGVDQSPNEDFGTEGSLADQSDLELQRIDDELNRRLEELDSGLAGEPDEMDKDNDEEESLLDEMEDEMKDDLAKNKQELGDSVLDDLPDEPEELPIKPPEKSCAQFRHELLNDSIRDISLDISPPASSLRDQYTSISRNWTDRSGNVIATGAMVDLRRGYVILDGIEGRQKIPYAKLGEADLNAIADYWRLPKLCSVGDRGSATRNWVGQTYTWKASNLCHKPLFFENVQLERYGHSRGPFAQPIHSVAHFFVRLATVPYQTAITPANECQYALGFYRPGNCAPWLKDPVPISLSGARRQALVSGFGGFTR